MEEDQRSEPDDEDVIVILDDDDTDVTGADGSETMEEGRPTSKPDDEDVIVISDDDDDTDVTENEPPGRLLGSPPGGERPLKTQRRDAGGTTGGGSGRAGGILQIDFKALVKVSYFVLYQHRTKSAHQDPVLSISNTDCARPPPSTLRNDSTRRGSNSSALPLTTSRRRRVGCRD
jgi:hypothetical protein